MTVDSTRYLEQQPPAHSRVQLEYRPSEALDAALHSFITPEYRTSIGPIALRSESYVQAPLQTGRHALEHPPAWAQHLLRYKNALAHIASHQIRLASFTEVTLLEQGGLAIYLELLPSEYEQRCLGQLALGSVARPYSAVVHISAGLVNNHYEVAAANLRSLVGLTYDQPTDGLQRTRYAPRQNMLWVEAAHLQERQQGSTIKTALS